MQKSILASVLLAVFLAFQPAASQAVVKIKTVEYKDGDTILEGKVAFDPKFKDKRPGVLVVHEWNGIGNYVTMRITKLAELGYIAFAADIYGRGVRPTTMDDSAKTSTLYKSNRPLMRHRAELGLAELKKQPDVDADKLVAMGYCFGGTTVLELARDGAPMKGFVSFHGGLSTPTPLDAKNIKGEVLAFQGADDSFVPPTEVEAFEKEMRDGKVNWELVKYGGAVHGFTNPEHGNDASTGLAYQKEADQKSWEALKVFLNRIFKG